MQSVRPRPGGAHVKEVEAATDAAVILQRSPPIAPADQLLAASEAGERFGLQPMASVKLAEQIPIEAEPCPACHAHPEHGRGARRSDGHAHINWVAAVCRAVLNHGERQGVEQGRAGRHRTDASCQPERWSDLPIEDGALRRVAQFAPERTRGELAEPEEHGAGAAAVVVDHASVRRQRMRHPVLVAVAGCDAGLCRCHLIRLTRRAAARWKLVGCWRHAVPPRWARGAPPVHHSPGARRGDL